MPASSRLAPAPLFPRGPLPSRLCNLERLWDTLRQRNLDGLVAYLRPNVLYLSSFAPPSNQSVQETNGYAAVVLSRHVPEQPIIVLAEFDLAAFWQTGSWIQDARPYQTLLLPFDVPLGDTPLDRFIPLAERQTARAQSARAAYAPSLADGVARAMADLGLQRGRVGFDDLRLARAVASEGVDVVDAYGTLKYIRQVKTAAEVDLLRTATRLNQEAIERTTRAWQPGVTWRQLTHIYHVTATQLGGFVRDPSAVVVANPVGPEPAVWMQSGLEDFEVQPGTHVMWDCHGTWQHYCWDGGKTWVVGEDARGAGKQALEANANGMAELQNALRPGARLSELQATSRKAMRQSSASNADEALIFFHGLGLEHIDMELTQSRQDWALEAGMVVSAHLLLPGDEHERAWLEEIFLVTPNGGEPFFSWGNGPLH